jgi:hypothetical protein
MQLLQYTLLTLVVAFFIQFWVISAITSKRPQNTVGKFYLSMVSACIMGILEVMIYDTYKSSVSLFYYLILGMMVYLFVYLYKSQTGIDEVDYLKQMMESHSREMELSKMVVERTENVQVKSIASTLIQRRKRDIDVIEKLLDDDSKKAPKEYFQAIPVAKPVAKPDVKPYVKPQEKPLAKPSSIMSL